MDELSLLQRIRTDAPEPSADALRRARAALLERAEAESDATRPVPRPKHRHRARWLGLGALGTAAAALTVTLVATNVLGVAGWRGGADAAAAAVLDKAALAAITSADPVLRPGQYLKIDTTAVYRYVGFRSDTDVDGQPVIAYLTIERNQLYVPADRSLDWVWVRGNTEPYETFSPEAAEVAQKRYEQSIAEFGTGPDILRAPGGAFYGNSSRPDYAALPRDPQQLLNHIYDTTRGAGRSPDGEALVWIADILRSGTVPADLRAALYRAAAGIPGVEITEQTANLDGRTGVAIGRVETVDDTRQDIIIDPSTGALIGERQVALGDTFGLPEGTPTGFTAVTTSVVDSAPAGGTPNGRADHW
ncbi:CU044_5270 family protein [Microbacterium sp. SORGH_AS_0888]|uniref:CU044_5270 family protein n=1 Tax=Microbacterium sp. SORGH_AS_0888 TaxID=3041791 RepID=UPI0027825C8E|nr:CU044_5270 family protein [Microbacterium sp. SORGH_AS_0888]MDQ1130727.1 hypothetical protein [Microbacterium sp. SORGH_AS_0888]